LFILFKINFTDQKLARQVRAQKKARSLSKIFKEKCWEAGINEVELKSVSQ